MYQGKTIAVVVPAYNEETQISIVLDTMPAFVDRIIVVNDCSTDRTAEVVMRHIVESKSSNTIRIRHNPEEIEPSFFNRADIFALEIKKEEEKLYSKHEIKNENEYDRIVLINNGENAKVGASIAIGYKWCRDHSIDCTAVMAGDAQMNPDELLDICKPVIEEGIDYVKGNRLRHKASRRLIPRHRFFGNSVLSALTKIASGYWHISDTQTGYTAISLAALEAIDLYKIYRTYGCPNDILVKLNIANCTIREIPIKPVYAVGEKSKMKIGKVIPLIGLLLIRSFFKRIVVKYFLNDFHPIFLFYCLAIVFGFVSFYFLVYVLFGLSAGAAITTGTYLGFVVFFISSILMSGFAMFLDIFDNEKLQK